jgi:hypothetical protein
MTRILAAALVALAVSGPAWADILDGNILHKVCADEDNPINQGICLGFSVGVFDALDDLDEIPGGFKFCPPSTSITGGQVSDIVTLWLANNPQYRHKNADSLVAAALSEAFPCK